MSLFFFVLFLFLLCALVQQSGVILKNVLTAHWEPTDPKFELPELTKQEKDTIKTQIIKSNLIADNNSKIRKATVMLYLVNIINC